MDGMSWIQDCSDALGDWLGLAVEAGLYAGLLAIVVLLINLLFRRWLSAGQMGLLWGLVLLRLLVPTGPGSALSLANIVKFDEAQTAHSYEALRPTLPVPAAATNAVPEIVRKLTELKSPAPAVAVADESSWLDGAACAIPFLWVIGGAAGLCYAVVNYIRFCLSVDRVGPCGDSRLLRLWAECCARARVKRAGRVVQFDGVEQPAIMGVLQPTLLLPTDGAALDDEQLRMVMLHELAHVRRWDIAANWALVMIRAIHWWNPVYWLAAARFRSLREQACDAFVVRTLDGESPNGYGELLLALAERRPNGARWRVILPASILSFFPSLFRRRAVRIRLQALRSASVKRGRWQMASAAALVVVLAVSGFTVAREQAEKPMDLPTWMAIHPDVVLAPKQSYAVQDVYAGPRETREYDVAKCLEQIAEQAGSNEKARQLLDFTLAGLYYRGQPGRDTSFSDYRNYGDRADPKEAAKTYVDTSLLKFEVSGTKLTVVAPAGLHDKLRPMLDAWAESGITQISVEARFLNSNRDLVSDLGVSWQFLEAFSSEREGAFPSASQDGGPVVHAEDRVDEYLPLVVSTLNKQQTTKLIEISQTDRRTNVLNAPKVTIFNGMEAEVSDCTQRPFVVGVFQRLAGATEPKIVVLEEGTKIKVRAVQGREKVHLQASLEMKSLGDVTTASTSYRGSQVSIQVPSVNRRCIDVGADLEDGQTLLVGSIPTGKQQRYSYYLLSARKIADSVPTTAGAASSK
jgi:bla regulator protein blaR1